VTNILHGFPLFERGFDRKKISTLAVIWVLLDCSAGPCEAATGRRANGIFRKNISQCVRELAIKCRDVGAATHDLSPTRESAALQTNYYHITGAAVDMRQQIPELPPLKGPRSISDFEGRVIAAPTNAAGQPTR
jgi:hypothetical protein